MQKFYTLLSHQVAFYVPEVGTDKAPDGGIYEDGPDIDNSILMWNHTQQYTSNRAALFVRQCWCGVDD
jgi:hypothetical protein